MLKHSINKSYIWLDWLSLLDKNIGLSHISNYKLDEMFHILDETFNHLKAEAPTTNANDLLSMHINISFQKVFEWLDELKSDQVLVSKARTSRARAENKREYIRKRYQITHSEMN